MRRRALRAGSRSRDSAARATELKTAEYTNSADDSGAGTTGQQKENAVASSLDGGIHEASGLARGPKLSLVPLGP